ncbi:unnamed protein product [Periconia digitata]|uniref:glucan endo-1,3-beta-D-glucosidase n=1 Tax=Periconia digitata TaxID=1303443 RepID=A0A9W4XJG9_9PLEO|nr:unnamed protein product [Periconia digitata]
MGSCLSRPSLPSSSRRKAAPTAWVPPPNTDNIFTPIQADDILSQIPISARHPVPRKGIEDDDDMVQVMHTNSFYANAFLGEQNRPIWTHPYVLWWGDRKGGIEAEGFIDSMGMCVGHTAVGDFEYGEGTPARFFTAPKKQSLVLGAREFDRETVLTTDSHLPFSVNINLKRGTAPDSPKITFPVVQGMGFVTANYHNATPMIQTGGRDGFQELLYVIPAPNETYDGTRSVKADPHTFTLPASFKGTIQVVKNPLGGEGETIYDQSYGTFVVEASLYATVNEAKGTYTFQYTKVGTSPALMFALPHHIQSLDPELKPTVTRLQLQTTTKGLATALKSDRLTFVEPALPTSMAFGPWVPPPTSTLPLRSQPRYPPDVLAALARIVDLDIRRVMTEKIPEESIYYAGKALSKFATILWISKDVLNNPPLTTAGLDKLKLEFSRFVQNRQKMTLQYDDQWKGLVSSAGFAGGQGADFGNTWYNDHHFHYGYFVYTAAVIGYIDPAWIALGDNKAWTNMLVKDFADSDDKGRDYPFSRCFDWWHGHSWAKGLIESADGKDQESTGEDGFSAFAIKMWGKTIGDANMEKRGNLMLAIQARSFNNYFYLSSTNTIQPSRFIDNKVAGILFEGKADHASTYNAISPPLQGPILNAHHLFSTAYFGADPALTHGIHMLPLSPPSYYLRPRAWVREEWDTHFSRDR